MQLQSGSQDQKAGYIGRIPVRNLWLLMLYASDLFQHQGFDRRTTEDSPDEIPDLVAEILASSVETRLRRQLNSKYSSRTCVVSRVRGKINLLATERHQLLSRGLVNCTFEELTIDTPRNRFVCAALFKAAFIVKKSNLSHKCKFFGNRMRELGVSIIAPISTQMGAELYSRNDANDRLMVEAAKLIFTLSLPNEEIGSKLLATPDREIRWIRKLFEKAIGGFYKAVLSKSEWDVSTGKALNWQVESKSSGIDSILPTMYTDIILKNKAKKRTLVIDTKFNSVLVKGYYRESTLRSGYLYQMYAYLKSQDNTTESHKPLSDGLLLHPAIGELIDEYVVIQGHKIRFATIDLDVPAQNIRDRLMELADRSLG